MNPRIIVIALLVAPVWLGCRHSRAQQTRVATQQDAGVVHVAVQSVAPFDESFIEQLQPRFPLTTDLALTSIAQTRATELQQLRALLVDLGVRLPDATSTLSGSTTGETTETSTTTSEGPGAMSDLPAPPVAPAPTITPFSLGQPTVDLDPALRHRAAAAFYQEIALLNRAIRDAAVATNTQPFVVRLLVTVEPSARRLPYDAYATVSFFGDGEPDSTLAERLSSYFDSPTTGAKLERSAYPDDGTAGQRAPGPPSVLSTLQKDLKDVNCDQPLQIIPMFVTDSLESSLDSAASERVLDAAMALAGTQSNVGVRAAARRRNEDRERSLGRGLNALFTISRPANNTIEARMGAVAVHDGYEMIARTYNITLLALVPTLEHFAKSKGADWPVQSARHEGLPCRNFAFVAQTDFRDALRGSRLKPWSHRRHAFEIQRIARENRVAVGALPELSVLLERARYEDYDSFAKAVGNTTTLLDLPPGVDSSSAARQLWNAAVTLATLSGSSRGTFTIPLTSRWYFHGETPGTLIDDTKITSLTLAGARGLTPGNVTAWLTAEDDKSRRVTLVNSTAEVSKDGTRLMVTFPSVANVLGADPSLIYAKVEQSTPNLPWAMGATHQWSAGAARTQGQWRATDESLQPTASAPLLTYFKKTDDATPKQEPAPATMSIPTRMILGKPDGTGSVVVAMTKADLAKPAPRVAVELQGVVIRLQESGLTFDGPKLIVSGHGLSTIPVAGLVDREKASVRSFYEKETVKPTGEKSKSWVLISESTLDVRVPVEAKEPAKKPSLE